MAIDLTKPIRFYDDRSTHDDTPALSEILWADGAHCLARVDGLSEPVLFRVDDGVVLTEDMLSWCAKNDVVPDTPAPDTEAPDDGCKEAVLHYAALCFNPSLCITTAGWREAEADVVAGIDMRLDGGHAPADVGAAILAWIDVEPRGVLHRRHNVSAEGRAIDISKPVRFYDDIEESAPPRVMKSVLWKNDTFCVCEIEDEEENNPVLFRLSDGEVLTREIGYWCAENYTDGPVAEERTALLDALRSCVTLKETSPRATDFITEAKDEFLTHLDAYAREREAHASKN